MREEYDGRLQSRKAARAMHDRTFRTLGTLRLLTAAGAVALAVWQFWLLPAAVAIFVGLLIWHSRVDRLMTLEQRAIAWYERAIARLEGQWAGAGESGERFRDPLHPYTADLDIFGHGSLFQLMNSARTAAGEETFARWLKAPASPDEARARQAAVRELSGNLDFREQVALLGDDIQAGLHPDMLLRWGSAPPEDIRPVHRIAAAILSGSLLVTFSGFMLQLWTLWPVMLVILLELAFFTSMRRRAGRILAGMELPGRDLGIMKALIERMEQQHFDAELLCSLVRRIRVAGVPASRQIARLQRLIELRDQARHSVFALAAEPFLWSMQFAFAIERWRQISGPHLGEWIAAMGELEALSSIAGYASEHTSDIYPDLSTSGPLFDGEGIAHPLLPDTAVRNNVHLSSEVQLLLVSGSNMSGKSTLLRSVGLNAVLAWTGAPVRATRLRLSRMAVGASMRVQDSLLDGKSRFYAEITRLRQIVDLAGSETTLLFLLDELLSGTNSHDRLIGSEAVVRNIVRLGSIGLVTTHDLALARIAEELAPHAVNVHFEDHIEDGRIAFDFRMRPGVVQKSNALELMRSVGLAV